MKELALAEIDIKNYVLWVVVGKTLGGCHAPFHFVSTPECHPQISVKLYLSMA